MRTVLSQAINNIDEKYFQRGERDFSYELYHQLRTLHSNQQIEITCETGKSRILTYQDPLLNNDLINKYFFDQRYANESESLLRVPDLLIHHYGNFDFQLVAVEIKKKFRSN